MNCINLLDNKMIEKTVIKLYDHIEQRKRHIISWERFSEEQLWLELISCILGSNVHFDTAKYCTRYLFEKGLLDINNILENKKMIEKKISIELNKKIFPPFTYGNGVKYRFPNSKAKFIIKTANEIYINNNTTIKEILKGNKNDNVRIKLIDFCYGIGIKQASLFLRNISYNKKLSIIDTHVIDYMIMMNLLNKIKKNNISTKQYLSIESTFISYASNLNKNPSSLDIAIWIVMRVYKKEVKN